ncbi:MAG TPA: helix-hairpin-helix domain-containing protein, partial [Deltaproteobacteria bacterium]|nr:helix-hairpin-helix domain-containing protein [Deltaproteobacteria bacterium]
FLPGEKDSVFMPQRSASLRLMQRLRDEAHRFAVTYHKHLRSKSISTVLEEIPGIGPKKARSILMHTSHLEELSRIRREDLVGLRCLTRSDVDRILEFIHQGD